MYTLSFPFLSFSFPHVPRVLHTSPIGRYLRRRSALGKDLKLWPDGGCSDSTMGVPFTLLRHFSLASSNKPKASSLDSDVIWSKRRQK